MERLPASQPLSAPSPPVPSVASPPPSPPRLPPLAWLQSQVPLVPWQVLGGGWGLVPGNQESRGEREQQEEGGRQHQQRQQQQRQGQQAGRFQLGCHAGFCASPSHSACGPFTGCVISIGGRGGRDRKVNRTVKKSLPPAASLHAVQSLMLLA